MEKQLMKMGDWVGNMGNKLINVSEQLEMKYKDRTDRQVGTAKKRKRC